MAWARKSYAFSLLIVSPGACSLHGSPHQDAQVPQRWPIAELWKKLKLWRLSTLTLKIGTSLLLIAKSGTQWSNDDSFGAVLEDNVSHTHGIYPCSPSLFVLCLFPFSFWWVVEPMLPGRSWYKLTNYTVPQNFAALYPTYRLFLFVPSS